MESRFSSEFFAGNREKLRQLFTGTAPIVVTANGLLQRGGDSTFNFHQDSSFWYLTGINEPDITLVMDKDKEYLIVPSRGDSRVAFDGAIDTSVLTRASGVDKVLDEAAGWKQFGTRLKRAKHVATLAPAPTYIDEHGFYANPARARLVSQVRGCNPAIELLDLRVHLARQRMIKQPAELSALQAAIDITCDTIKEVTKPAKRTKYSFEYELEAELTRGFRRRGASGHAFAPIVASGIRGCTLHNVANNSAVAADEFVVLDVGAEVEHYAADITRTVPLGSSMSRRQEAVLEAVVEVQQYAKSLLKPGVMIRQYEAQVAQYLGEKLRELGLVKTIDTQEVRRFYPHATSHFLGLDVHDTGDYDMPLAPGMVLTVEPGIYIAEEAIGVRIEDDALITESGIDVLSGRLPQVLL